MSLPVVDEVEDVLYSAVGNRVTAFELTKHASHTLPVESRSDIALLAVNHRGTLLVALDGEASGCWVVASYTLFHTS